MTSTPATRPVLHEEQYLGHSLRVIEHERYLQGYFCLVIDGRTWGHAGQDVAKVAAYGRHALDLNAEDDRLTPEMVRLASWKPGHDGAAVKAQVGDIASLYSRGTTRIGLVTKVTKTGTATVAYVTPGGVQEAARHNWKPTVTRKTAKLGEYRVLGGPLAAHSNADVSAAFAGSEA